MPMHDYGLVCLEWASLGTSVNLGWLMQGS